MPEPPEQLRQGDLVWAEVPDPRGNVKKRPVVIITESGEIIFDEMIVGVAVTTTYPDPPPETHVELPWAPRGHPATGLARRSAAACNWIVPLRPSQVLERKGYVPSKTLLQIIKRVRGLNTEAHDGIDE